MNCAIRFSFQKDTKNLPSVIKKKSALDIHEISYFSKLSDISNCKKLVGHKTAYRIKMGQYRIGFYFESNTVEFVRILARKDIYRYFPKNK